MGDGIRVRVNFVSISPVQPLINIAIKNNYGITVFTASTRVQNQYRFAVPVTTGEIVCRLSNLPLLPGTYSIDLYLSEEYQNLDVIYDAISFEVLDADVFGTGQVPTSNDGAIFWPAEFQMISSERRTGECVSESASNADVC